MDDGKGQAEDENSTTGDKQHLTTSVSIDSAPFSSLINMSSATSGLHVHPEQGFHRSLSDRPDFK
jgi:hypothetical protein